ncbi:MAG: amidohydrolase [Kiloniellaceae bacterium]
MSQAIGLSEELSQQMTAWRHDLHRHPELGFEETRTARLAAERLRAAGLEVHEGVGGTGVVGVLRRGNGPGSIGLRADMDALAIAEENTFDHRSRHPGRMHACGHDGHTAMLLGAARHLAAEGNFSGTAVFIFQPAEEHGRGALAMIDDGLFKRFPVDAVYAIHNLPSLEAGKLAVREGAIMACEDTFEIRVEGKGTHAALPHRGIDPILVGAEIVTALQSLVSRTLDPLDNAVVSVTDFRCDGTRNVIPARVAISGDARSFGPKVQDHIETGMERIAAGICAAHGASHRLSYKREFAATINTAREAAAAAAVAEAAFGAGRVDRDCPALMASEDFGFMLQQKPGAYILLGNGGDGPGGCGLHSPNYDFNDDVLSTGAGFWVRLVESQLSG